MLYIKHIDLTRLGTDSGAADDGKRASSVAWSCTSGREALGEGVWGRGGAGTWASRRMRWILGDLYLRLSQFS